LAKDRAPLNGASETFHFVSASPASGSAGGGACATPATPAGAESSVVGQAVPPASPAGGRSALTLPGGNGAGSSQVRYTVKAKALKRWAEERLSLHPHADGAIEAVFRYEGTTCTNMGRPLAFHYHVSLGPKEDGYRIQDQRCGPAPGDTGHTYMCLYLENPGELSAAIAREKTFLGQPLSAVLSWPRVECAPGCYCEPASREHKWGIVLETIHYALEHQDRDAQQETKP
jgi:hypothetical protein